MRVAFAALLLLVAMPALVSRQERVNQNDRTVQELIQLERDWIAASLRRDKAWLARFFADELVVTHPTIGVVKNKAQEIADAMDPSQTPESMILGNMKVSVAGNVAIVTGTAFETGGGAHLTDRSRGYLFTDTFLRRDGRWQLLGSHSSRLPAAEIGPEERRQIEEELRMIEDEWAQVIVNRELSVLERILAPDFVGADDDGFSDKAQEVESYRENTVRFTSALNEKCKGAHLHERRGRPDGRGQHERDRRGRPGTPSALALDRHLHPPRRRLAMCRQPFNPPHEGLAEPPPQTRECSASPGFDNATLSARLGLELHPDKTRRVDLSRAVTRQETPSTR